MIANQVIVFLIAFVQILSEILSFLIFARVILSWFNPRPNRFTEFIYYSTEPIMVLAKKITPKLGMIDISPIVALLGLNIVTALLLNLILYVTPYIESVF